MKNNRVKNLKRTIVSNFWGSLERIDFDFKFKNGNWKHLTHEAYGKSDGVAVLLYNPESKNVLLSKQFRIPVYISDDSDGISIEVCGGAIDADELPEVTALREVQEEMGYHISSLKAISTVYLSPGIVKERVHLFVGIYNENDKINDAGGGLEVEGEEIEVIEVSLKEALQMIESKDIIDARTIMLLQYVVINKLIN